MRIRIKKKKKGLVHISEIVNDVMKKFTPFVTAPSDNVIAVTNKLFGEHNAELLHEEFKKMDVIRYPDQSSYDSHFVEFCKGFITASNVELNKKWKKVKK